MAKASGIGVGIVGMGAGLPEEVRTNDWWSDDYIKAHLRGLGDDIVAGAKALVAN